VGRADPDRDARQSGERDDPAHDLRRPERALQMDEAGGKIGDPDPAAVIVLEVGLDDRGVAHIA
jgi:hypothetical protein